MFRNPNRLFASAVLLTFLAAQPSYAAPLQLNLPNPNLAPRASAFSSHPAGLIYAKQSQLAGMTIGNGFRAIATPANSAKTTMDSMWEGLKKGALQVGLQFATPGLDPLLGGMASSIITGAIDGLISPADPNKPLDPKRKGIFGGIADTFHEALKGFKEIGVIKPGDTVGNAQRIAQLTDFTQITQQQGLAAAIETYGAGFLYRSSVESLITAGTNFSIQQAINAQLKDSNNLVELEGRQVLQISLGTGPNGVKQYLWVDATTHAPIASLQGQDYIRYIAPPKVDTVTHVAAAINTEITRTLEDGSKLILEVRDGLVTKARLTRGDQSWLFTGNEVGDLQLSSDGTIFTGQLVDEPTGLSFIFDRGSLTKTVLLPTITSALSVGQLAAVADILESSSPILFEPTPEMTQQHLQDFNLEVGNLQNLLAAKFGTNKAQALVAEFKQSGQTVIQTPETQANERQRLAEQTSSVELSDSERRTMGEVVTDWANGLRAKGIQMGANAEEGGLAYWAGFGVYFLGDLTDIGADPLRIGEGFGKAFAEDLPNKHYGAALWHITEDVFRGIQFIPGIALASKSVSGAIKTVQTSGKVAEATGALNRVKSGVMNFVSTWSKRFGIGDDVLGVASDAKGSLKYEYAFNESNFKGLAHAASTEKLKSLASGINPKQLKANNRLGSAFYLSEDSGTAIAEVKYKAKISGGGGPDIVVQYDLNLSKAKVLDFTDPAIRAKYGCVPDPNSYVTGRNAATLAKQDGYNVIKYESIRNPGHNNYAVLDNADFDELLKARLPLQ